MNSTLYVVKYHPPNVKLWHILMVMVYLCIDHYRKSRNY